MAYRYLRLHTTFKEGIDELLFNYRVTASTAHESGLTPFWPRDQTKLPALHPPLCTTGVTNEWCAAAEHSCTAMLHRTVSCWRSCAKKEAFRTKGLNTLFITVQGHSCAGQQYLPIGRLTSLEQQKFGEVRVQTVTRNWHHHWRAGGSTSHTTCSTFGCTATISTPQQGHAPTSLQRMTSFLRGILEYPCRMASSRHRLF